MSETIVIAILSSGALSALIGGVFQIILSRKSKIRKQLEKLEKDSLRTQILMMMSDYPDEKQEILTLGERYFGQLNADWYLTPLFKKWLQKKEIPAPVWFKED